jgi:hypothetical protein
MVQPPLRGVTTSPANWWWRAELAGERPVTLDRSTAPDGGDPRPAVLFDLDGVLADASLRQHHLEGSRRDWDAFFDGVGDDELIYDVARLLRLLDPAVVVVLLTGRPARVHPQTLGWLGRHALRWDLLVMRDYGDYSAARDFKQRSVGELRSVGLDPQLAFEDDRRNVEMFRAEGVPCVYIHSGYYD